MAGLLIIAHAPLASSLRAVANHVYPDCAGRLEVLDVPPDKHGIIPKMHVDALMRLRRNVERLGK